MISIIVAIGNHNLIGKGNDLPWHYPEDLQYFKEKTLNKTVLMGENTFYSILNRLHKPLPKRNNIVATLDKEFTYPGVTVIHDLISFLKQPHQEEIFIIGGKQIYRLALPYADRLYITHVNRDYEGDVYFPEIDYQHYRVIEENIVDELVFRIYEKVK